MKNYEFFNKSYEGYIKKGDRIYKRFRATRNGMRL